MTLLGQEYSLTFIYAKLWIIDVNYYGRYNPCQILKHRGFNDNEAIDGVGHSL